MQEDVLKLILLALGQGAPIARKTLVIYVVQMLTEDYPQVRTYLSVNFTIHMLRSPKHVLVTLFNFCIELRVSTSLNAMENRR